MRMDSILGPPQPHPHRGLPNGVSNLIDPNDGELESRVHPSSPSNGLLLGVQYSHSNELQFGEHELAQTQLCFDSHSHFGRSPALPECSRSRPNLWKGEGRNQRPRVIQMEKKAGRAAASAVPAKPSTTTGSEKRVGGPKTGRLDGNGDKGFAKGNIKTPVRCSETNAK
ncbi:hypothetical protein JTB14_025424 [Gonioctena quinquepunctata]|nr:hypothetical protein JTB14_025424 [Gonioctena quinquepunctata]